MSDKSTRYADEVIVLHQFFVDWFTGKLPKTQDAFARFAAAMAEGFAIVSPDGRLSERDPLLDGLYAAHGARQDVRIWIQNVQVRRQSGTLSIVTYEEWQQSGDDTPTARLSTVIFQDSDSAPAGLLWLHVHETWLPR